MNKSLLFLLLPALLLADTHVATSTARFNGTSTLHDFEGKATSDPAPATWTPTETGIVLTIPRIRFDTKTLTTDHVKRDANMMHMLAPAAHPDIVGSVQAWALTPGTPSEQTLTLELNGVSKEIPVNVLSVSEDAEGLQLVCEFSLSLKAFSLQRPSVLGVIRVGDIVKLHVETTLRTP